MPPATIAVSLFARTVPPPMLAGVEPNPGSRGTGDVGDPDRPFAHIHGAGFRAVYDLGDLDRSRFVIATGQSGNPLSPHYRDFLQRWRDGGTVRMPAAPEGAVRRLVLAPRD